MDKGVGWIFSREMGGKDDASSFPYKVTPRGNLPLKTPCVLLPPYNCIPVSSMKQEVQANSKAISPWGGGAFKGAWLRV